jgi:hypothetical protein
MYSHETMKSLINDLKQDELNNYLDAAYVFIGNLHNAFVTFKTKRIH